MSAPDPHDEWLLTAEAAALVPVSERSLRRYADRGLLPYRLLPGRHRRFRRADVEAFRDQMNAGVR